MEFGAECLFYMVGRVDHWIPVFMGMTELKGNSP